MIGTAPVAPPKKAVLDPPTPEDLITLLDLRERFEKFFEKAGQAWLDGQIATNPEFKRVTRKTGWVVDYDRDVLVYAYYANTQDYHDYTDTEALIPLDDLVPGYGEIREFLAALATAPRITD